MRGIRSVGIGLLLGGLLSVGYVSFAQGGSGQPLPLVHALRVAAAAADVELVVAGVPVADVYLPTTSDDWGIVLRQLAAVYGLTVCDLGPSTLLVTDSEHAANLCGGASDENEEPTEPAGAASEPEGELPALETEPEQEPEPAALVYRVRVLQLDETRAVDAGLDWSGGVLATAGGIVAGAAAMANGVIPVTEMGRLVRFLESEGVAVRLEDVELRALAGQTVRFNRGGSISVNLVGGGAGTIAERYEYGLGLDLAGELVDGVVTLAYTFRDAAPSNVSDPSNVQIASTTSSSLVRVPCGHAVVLAAVGSDREDHQGRGLPGLAEVPAVGYVFGVGGSIAGRSSFVLTVDVGCSA